MLPDLIASNIAGIGQYTYTCFMTYKGVHRQSDLFIKFSITKPYRYPLPPTINHPDPASTSNTHHSSSIHPPFLWANQPFTTHPIPTIQENGSIHQLNGHQPPMPSQAPKLIGIRQALEPPRVLRLSPRGRRATQAVPGMNGGQPVRAQVDRLIHGWSSD